MPFTSSGYFLKTEIAGHEINLFKLSEMLSLTFILFWATLSYILDRYRKGTDNMGTTTINFKHLMVFWVLIRVLEI
jgi:hypothetical protein